MGNRNYVVSRLNEFINCSWNQGQFCGSNGQCIKFECQEWHEDVPCYPELVRDENYGFAICPKCGVSYGKAALTGEEYATAQRSAQ
jgi:hypothetical protein